MTSRSSTPSEGEIIESDSEKATKSLMSVHGTPVDLQSRKRIPVSRSPSPIQSPRRRKSLTRARSRSPYRNPRGAKRTREDGRHDPHDRDEPRHFKVYYEDRSSTEKTKSRRPYQENGRGAGPDPRSRYDEQELNGRQRNKRPRTFSRSPPRVGERKPGRDIHTHIKSDDRPRIEKARGGSGYQESRRHLSPDHKSVSSQGHTPDAAASTRREAEISNDQGREKRISKHVIGSLTDKYVPRLTMVVTY